MQKRNSNKKGKGQKSIAFYAHIKRSALPKLLGRYKFQKICDSAADNVVGGSWWVHYPSGSNHSDVVLVSVVVKSQLWKTRPYITEYHVISLFGTNSEMMLKISIGFLENRIQG